MRQELVKCEPIIRVEGEDRGLVRLVLLGGGGDRSGNCPTAGMKAETVVTAEFRLFVEHRMHEISKLQTQGLGQDLGVERAFEAPCFGTPLPPRGWRGVGV